MPKWAQSIPEQPCGGRHHLVSRQIGMFGPPTPTISRPMCGGVEQVGKPDTCMPFNAVSGSGLKCDVRVLRKILCSTARSSHFKGLARGAATAAELSVLTSGFTEAAIADSLTSHLASFTSQEIRKLLPTPIGKANRRYREVSTTRGFVHTRRCVW